MANLGACLLFACSFFHSTTNAAILTATASGNWNSNSTWDCACQPSIGDEIYLPTGVTVTIPNSIVIDLSTSGTTNVHITGGTLVFGNNISCLMLSSTSVLNFWSGTIDPGNSNGSPHSYIRIGTCSNGNCDYTKDEILSAVPPVAFTNNGTSSLLPVELKSFSARLLDERIALEWVTASEQNNSGFEVQRSSDGVDFQRIGWLDGNGTTTEEHRYIYTDPVPKLGFNYYRLVQMDFDEQTSASPVQVVKMDKAKNKLTLKMSAGENLLRISVPQAEGGRSQAEIFDLNGTI
ncbi:MAG: hypothetical protein AAB316_03445, partial [Bacteroidota bacterium]